MRKILVLLDAEIAGNTGFRVIISQPRQMFDKSYAREQTANKLLKKISYFEDFKGQRASLESQNKLIICLIDAINAEQDNSLKQYQPEERASEKNYKNIIRQAEELDKCFLLNPLLLKEPSCCQPKMELLSEKISAALKAIKEDRTGTMSRWYMFNDIIMGIHEWRAKAAKARLEEIYQIKQAIVRYKKIIKNVKKKRNTKGIAA